MTTDQKLFSIAAAEHQLHRSVIERLIRELDSIMRRYPRIGERGSTVRTVINNAKAVLAQRKD